jgi:hypothetical protein
MRFDRRLFLAASAAAALPRRLLAQPVAVLRPEDFGALGDGHHNDTQAFAALSAEVNRCGGGTIRFQAGKTYLVGEQHRGGPFGWSPLPILQLQGLTAPLRILGNGARLRCVPKLRFGTFDVQSGDPVQRKLPNYRGEELATPYQAMISVHDSRSPIEIRDLELDGNIEQQIIGGPYGDSGWQIPNSGMWLKDNHSSETVVNVFSHHHGQDGAILDADDRRSARSRFERFVARHNGRQGASITGGRGYDFADCEFSFTGRTVLKSAPCAGVDIEAEGEKIVRDLTFTRCKFLDNTGVGLLAEAGDGEGALFRECLFVGDEVWSAWPRKPRFIFEHCTFAGAAVNAFADKDPELATKFIRCRFTDDPTLSPSGKLFYFKGDAGPCVNLGQSLNVLFDECTVDLRHNAVLPWSWAATYRNCTMAQKSPVTAFAKGKYYGRTTIQAPADLYGSMILGTVILNGRVLPHGPVGSDVKPW